MNRVLAGLTLAAVCAGVSTRAADPDLSALQQRVEAISAIKRLQHA
jgi:hypothetical protein